MSQLDRAAVKRLRSALVDLIRCRPDDWPDLLSGIAGSACDLNLPSLMRMADATAGIAATAKRLAEERGEGGGAGPMPGQDPG
jgi:hypothetical protein